MKAEIVEVLGEDYKQLNYDPLIAACEELLAASRLVFDKDGYSIVNKRVTNK